MGNCLRLGISKIGLAWTKRRMKTSNKRNAISLLILGTQAVGKTTIALRLWKFKRALPDLNYVQTKGFNTYAIRRKNKSTINLYDLGGHSSIQELWDHYYADAHGIIFVVDVSNPESLSESAVVFSKVVNDERIRGKPILLLANKQDLGGASEVELDSVMNLQEVVNAARCLTRLDESAATDLKNDKGIFDGFRWLVSHITNHYHELNDRVMHDILEEKNREKARRSAIKEQLEQSQSIPITNISQDRPSSQKSLRSKSFVRDESGIDLQQGHPHNNEYESTKSHSQKPGPSLMQSKQPTNYLIKSRPNSSLGESNNPFLLPRTSSTAPSTKRRSLPTLQPLSGKSTNLTLVPVNRFFTNVTGAEGTLQQKSGSGGGVDPFVVSTTNHPPEASTVLNSDPISSSSMIVSTGRLSPEGANSESGNSSDEGGIINHGFDDKTENFLHSSETVVKSDPPDQKQNDKNIYAIIPPNMPSVTDVSPMGSVDDVLASPDKFRKLIRTESSDTERALEILMVTTLAQVHQDHISNGRRGSSTSTHGSIALSLSSFKSEDTNVMDGWSSSRDAEEDVTTHSQSQSRNQSRAAMNRGIMTSQLPLGAGANVFTVPGNITSTTPKQNISRGEKEKGTKSGLMRGVGIGKNKTNPLLPGMGGSTRASTGIGHHSATTTTTTTRLPKVVGVTGGATPNASSRNPVVSLTSKRSRENVFIVGPPSTGGGGGGKNKLKNTSFTGFAESLETKSQFTRRPPQTPVERISSPQENGPRD